MPTTRVSPHAYSCCCRQCSDMIAAIVSGAFTDSELVHLAEKRNQVCDCRDCAAMRSGAR